jgi:hypothetical protein
MRKCTGLNVRTFDILENTVRGISKSPVEIQQGRPKQIGPDLQNDLPSPSASANLLVHPEYVKV